MQYDHQNHHLELLNQNKIKKKMAQPPQSGQAMKE